MRLSALRVRTRRDAPADADAISHQLLVRGGYVRRVVVTLADGTRGYGEAAPFPAVTGETQASTLAAVSALATVLQGADARRWLLA